jgi:hypothetical protein
MEFSFDLSEAGRFLDLFSEGAPHTFQYFDDTKQTTDEDAAGHFVGNLEDHSQFLMRLNKRGRGIYFMVNEGDGMGRSGENVVKIRALFADLDGAPIEPIMACPLEPHIILQSGPYTYHAYWLVDDCPLDQFSDLQLRIAAKFDSDVGVKDLPRVMRIPGFYNCKTKYGEPFRVKTLALEQCLPYKVASVIEALGLDSVEIKEKAAKCTIGLSLDGLEPKSIPEGQRHAWLLKQSYAMACDNVSPADIFVRTMGLNYTYCVEPKPYKEVEEIVKSALEKVPPVDLGGLINSYKKEAPAKPEEPDNVLSNTPNPESNAGDVSFALSEDFLLSAPGLVGEITAWLSESNYYWQPSYGVAAALAFVGMIKGHNVCTEENARTNLLTIAIGPSSSGKTQPLKRIIALARAAGLSHRLSGEPTSEQGMVRGLVDAGHKTLIPWDEIGEAFKKMFASNTPYYKAGIIRLILKLYSMADETVLGSQYANSDSKNPRIDLHQPCLCLYGTSTIDGVYSAFSSVEAVNGFAARLLLFETHNYIAERQPVGMAPIPQSLINRVIAVAKDEKPEPNQGNLSNVYIPPIPKVIPYNPEARKLMAAALKRFEELKNSAILAKRPAEESIWGRAYEQATKIALTVEDGDAITPESASWAIELVSQLYQKMIVASRERISDNQTHAEINGLLRLIKDAHPKWVDTNYLYRASRAIPRQRRKDYLMGLIEEGTIVSKEEGTGGRKRTLYRYQG